MTYAFAESGAGTHVEIRVARPKPRDMAFLEKVGPVFRATIASEVAALRKMLEGRGGGPAAIEEPAPPVSAARFATAPVRAR